MLESLPVTVDVIYQGLALVKGANARSEAEGLFVELDVPMPVGTRLDLVTPDGNKSGRVESVVEGTGAGMWIGFGAAKAKPGPSKEKEKAAEPNAPMAEMKSAPPVPLNADKDDSSDEEEAPEDEKADEKEPSKSDDGGKKGKRRKPRKTVIGR
jgi:hypothetical protein